MPVPDKDYKRPAWSSNVLSLVLRGPGIQAGIVSRVVCKNLGKNDQTTDSCADSNLRYSAVPTVSVAANVDDAQAVVRNNQGNNRIIEARDAQKRTHSPFGKMRTKKMVSLQI
jgi:hypothetical protein